MVVMVVGLFMLGLGMAVIGALFLAACFMPTFGGSRGSQAVPAVFGGLMVAAGLVLVFFAGGVA